MPELAALTEAAVGLLAQLIATPSFSREETATATLIFDFLAAHGARPQRQGHNVWAAAPGYAPERPTILLNSHHDTVQPGVAWTHPPFVATWEGDKLIGLGSNDAGASAVSLLAASATLMPAMVSDALTPVPAPPRSVCRVAPW